MRLRVDWPAFRTVYFTRFLFLGTVCRRWYPADRSPPDLGVVFHSVYGFGYQDRRYKCYARLDLKRGSFLWGYDVEAA